ncbi:RES family NAD+ phosphorylase [Chitinophagaceae bacterium 26-R-25]|nr:RES family NAD+ phosphorylase [Chitinophagaceae bacterium 26-R-25]
MEVFRISREEHSTSLSSSGSANRWNSKGQQVIYTGSSRSLSTLELVVHRGSIKPTFPYKVMVISIADDDHLIKQIKSQNLPKSWRSMAAYPELQHIGSSWYNLRATLVLKVPSAIIPLEFNYIINTEHPEFGTKVRLVRTEDYFWDPRLA